MKIKKNSNGIQKITFAIFFVLLLLRVFSPILEQWIWHATPPDYRGIPLWYKIYYLFCTYMLASIVLWSNGDQLSKLNMDRLFVILFIFTGIIIALYYLPTILGAMTLLATSVIFRRLIKNNFKFKATVPNYSRIILIFIVGLLPVILFYLAKLFFDIPLGNNETFIITAYYADLPQVVVEEIIYRGLLWMFLEDLGIGESKILYIQAALFWFSHYYYRSHPIDFWLWTPLASVWLGLLVWRSKSITPSAIGHFMFNLFTVLSR